jgi:hypothetical protein
MPQQSGVQGLPEGAIVKPFAPQSVSGLPEGAVVKPFAGSGAQPAAPRKGNLGDLQTLDPNQKGMQPAGTAEPTTPVEAIDPDDTGAMNGLLRFGKSLLKMPGNIGDAFTKEEAPEETPAATVIAGQYNIPRPLALALHRIIIEPMVRQHELAKAYETISAEHPDQNGDFDGPQHRANMHHIASVFPLVGPMAGDMVERYMQGDKSGAISELLSNIGGGAALDSMSKIGAARLSKTLAKVAPKVETIAGETMPKLASQERGAATSAHSAARIENEPEIAGKQQAGGQQAIKNVARKATEDSINRVNASRQPTIETQTQELTPVPSKQKALGTGTPAPANRQLGAGEELATNDQLATGEETQATGGAAQKPPKITASVDVEKPANIKPADAKAAAKQVNSFGDAADQIEAAAKPVYQKLDEVSEGEFTGMREQRKAALKVLRQPNSMEAWTKAQDSLDAADSSIDAMFEKHKDVISKEDWKSANSAWRDAKVLDRLHATVEGAFNGVKEDVAQRTGIPRTLKGGQLTKRLGDLLEKQKPDVERVIGKEGVDNLYKVADLLTNKPRQFHEATQNIARYMAHRFGAGAVAGGAIGHFVPGVGTGTGALVGAGAQDALRHVMHSAATNPRVAGLITNAIKAGSTAKVYGPLIANAIDKEDQGEEQK